jgi:hypothetical protein
MYALAVRRTRRRSKRRNFKLFKARVAERLVVVEDPYDASKVIVQYEYALKRMHRARISVPTAARMLRDHCARARNPVATMGGLSKGAMWLGIGALVALGLYVVADALGLYAKKQDSTPLSPQLPTTVP